MKEAKQELSEFKAAWQAKCPRCRIGHVYKGPAYGLKVQKMNKHCEYCGLRYEREPGYFYGAMYVTYAFAIAEMVAACMATYIITANDSSFVLYATVAILSVVLMSPFNYRYSRIILMYWLTPGLRYDPNVKKKEVDVRASA
ncbi:DUF983 domain-containing protein [Sphingobacterium thalpophilum]|uniref:DUF983 domain-containing protein n=1 Tax=Sphingobacterium thalpophilum TaxID=259 RepID=A0A4U9W6U8_9SPHI|nr:DUF983 domain-containing protein [Sphingobacterium thalpophilum]VTR54551.1 Uncharacterised protein [Sphingobacterium thalpophilum]